MKNRGRSSPFAATIGARRRQRAPRPGHGGRQQRCASPSPGLWGVGHMGGYKLATARAFYRVKKAR